MKHVIIKMEKRNDNMLYYCVVLQDKYVDGYRAFLGSNLLGSYGGLPVVVSIYSITLPAIEFDNMQVVVYLRGTDTRFDHRFYISTERVSSSQIDSVYKAIDLLNAEIDVAIECGDI